jgi:hypothetical protein
MINHESWSDSLVKSLLKINLAGEARRRRGLCDRSSRAYRQYSLTALTTANGRGIGIKKFADGRSI